MLKNAVLTDITIVLKYTHNSKKEGMVKMICSKCGNEIPDGAQHCDSCGASFGIVTKEENVVTGTVGAVLGAVLGAASIILLSQLGYIASISGLILAVCTLKGYELLGGRLSTKGIVISIVLMLVTPYLADRLDWAIVLVREWGAYGVTLGGAFAAVPELLADGSIEMGMYAKNLAMIYGFTLFGAFTTVKSAIKK